MPSTPAPDARLPSCPAPRGRTRTLLLLLASLSALPGALAGPSGAASGAGSALARLDTLGRDWWGDQHSQGVAAAPADRTLTLLDAERADPTTWLALSLILQLDPADRWRVQNGQSYVQTAPSSAEAELLAEIGPRVGLRHPRTYEVRTEANTVVWLGLTSPQGTVDVPVAWPTEWRTVEAWRQMRAVGWAPPELDPVGLIDGSFEDPIALRVAWSASGVAVQDPARTTLGAHSVRLEGDAELVQRVGLAAGVTVSAHARLTAEGSAVGVVLRWEDDDGRSLGEVASTSVTDGSWADVEAKGVCPDGASAVAVTLRAKGGGFANADDVRFTRSDAAPGAPRKLVRAWSGTAVRLLADPAQVPDAETHLAHIDQAVRGALALLGQPTAGVVDVRFGPTPMSLPICSATSDPEATACILRADLRELWGPPGNPLFAAAFTTALSGADIPAARGDLRTGLSFREGPPPAAWVSFSRWLLDAYGTAAVRAAWQIHDLSTFEAGNKGIEGLQAVWEH